MGKCIYTKVLYILLRAALLPFCLLCAAHSHVYIGRHTRDSGTWFPPINVPFPRFAPISTRSRFVESPESIYIYTYIYVCVCVCGILIEVGDGVYECVWCVLSDSLLMAIQTSTFGLFRAYRVMLMCIYITEARRTPPARFYEEVPGWLEVRGINVAQIE